MNSTAGVRVTKLPGEGGYWFWICKVRNSAGQADPWCIQESLAVEYPSQTDAMAAAVKHVAHHDPTGELTLTFDAFMAATG